MTGEPIEVIKLSPRDNKAVADKVLEDWDDVCNELGITHFLVYGTCLGLYRDQSYIEGDHDMDVGIDCNDADRAVLIGRLRELGFTIDPPVYGEHVHRDDVYLDISPTWCMKESAAFFKSFDEIVYNGRPYNAPHPIEAYLEAFYGEEWRTPQDWRTWGRGKRIVYTSGNFDLFHVGHLNFLERARELGDVLVVGVGTDESIIELRGKSPIIPYEQRCRIVRALECVDFVVPWTSEMQGVERIMASGATTRAVSPLYSQDQPEAKAELERRGVKHVVIPRTLIISSTATKEACYEEVVDTRAGVGVSGSGVQSPEAHAALAHALAPNGDAGSPHPDA